MQFLRTHVQTLFSKPNLFKSLSSEFHLTPCCQEKLQMLKSVGIFQKNKKAYWVNKNEMEYPLQEQGEEPRKGCVYHVKEDIPVSWKNLWYITTTVEGMTVDEALKQLSFIPKKGAYYVKAAIQEAQEMAVKEHNIEFKSNLWVSKSFPMTERIVFRGIQRKARRAPAKLKTYRSYYFLRLEEGSPPPNFRKNPTGEEMFEAWLQRMRSRRISGSL